MDSGGRISLVPGVVVNFLVGRRSIRTAILTDGPGLYGLPKRATMLVALVLGSGVEDRSKVLARYSVDRAPAVRHAP